MNKIPKSKLFFVLITLIILIAGIITLIYLTACDCCNNNPFSTCPISAISDLYENENYIYKKRENPVNGVSFTILNKRTDETTKFMTHNGEHYEITDDGKYFIQYRERVNSNTYASANFISIYDTSTNKLIDRFNGTQFELKHEDRFFLFIALPQNKDMINFYNEDTRTLTVPLMICNSGTHNKCIEYDSFEEKIL